MVRVPLVFAQAAPAVPSWLFYVGPLIAGIGVALAYERWVVENRVHIQKTKLEAELSHERRQREHLEKQLADATQDVESAYQAIAETLNDINERDISSNDVVRLHRLLGKLKKWSSLDREISDYKVAARELKQSSASFFRKAIHQAIKDCKNQTPEFQEFLPWKRQENVQNFHADVMNYVDWVYDCLYISGHPRNNPLNRFVEQPAISSVKPYIAAIAYIKEKGNWKKLNLEQARALRAMFDELLERLPKEF